MILCPEFAGNQKNVMTEEQANTKLTTLSQKDDMDLYTYYHWMDTIFIGISRRDLVIHDRENTVIFNKAEQYVLKDIIAILGFRLIIPELRLYIIEYRADLNFSFYRAFKKAKTYLYIHNIKVQI